MPTTLDYNTDLLERVCAGLDWAATAKPLALALRHRGVLVDDIAALLHRALELRPPESVPDLTPYDPTALEAAADCLRTGTMVSVIPWIT